MANNVTIPATGSGTATPAVETYDTTGSGGPQRQGVTLASIGAPASITALTAGSKTSANSIPVVVASDQAAIAVSGTFWQTTQPISAASLPLPTGAATSALQTTINTTLGTPFQAGGSIGNTAFGATQSGTWNITNISGTVSLPTGAATQTTLAAVLAALPSALTAAGALKTGVVVANPSSVLTRPANTTAYAAGQLIASNVTAGSVVVPSFTATPGSAGNGSIKRLRLYSNKTSGMGGVQLQVELWTTAPTFTNGDGGTYAVATGAAGWIGSFTFDATQVGDGMYCVAMPDAGNSVDFALASGTAIFWTLKTNSVFTPASAQTFTAVPEITQN